MGDFGTYAPYLSDPLVLVGFFVFAFFSFSRYLVKKGVIPTITRTAGYRLLRSILLYGFLLGILIIGLGFGLRYTELSKAEQENAVRIIQSEILVNQQTIGEISKNTEQMLELFQVVSQSLRNDGLPIWSTLFPADNLSLTFADPEISKLVETAMATLDASGILKDELEVTKATASARVLAATIERTRSTVASLADLDHVRYVVRHNAFDAHLNILRKVEIVNLTTLQTTYGNWHTVRSNFDVVSRNMIEYLDALQAFLQPTDNTIDRLSLQKVLTAERLAISVLTQHAADLAEAMEATNSLVQTVSAEPGQVH